MNLINGAYKNNIEHFINLGSSCIYPKKAKQPIKEEYLLSDYLEKSNEAYALAKIVGLKYCEFYNQQHGTSYFTLMPCNLYGPNDNFNLKNSHFIPALIKKIVNSTNTKNSKIEIWGTGKPKREVMYVDDLARAIYFVLIKKMTKDKNLSKIIKRNSVINVGSGNEFSAHIKLVRLKHSLSDWWQDPTAVPSFIKWLQDNTKITADVDFEGGSLVMTDERILDAPFIFMTGHDRDIVLNRSLAKDGPLAEGFSRKERIAMRKYLINRGGLLFFDDCGFNGNFASRFRRELQSVLPEFQLANIPHDHKLYKVYYQLAEPPTGGDVFWNSGYKPKQTQFKFQKGIFIGNRLAVVFNRKDYLCCMETSEVDSRARLQDRRSPDVHRFMTNLLVYAMKYGGNTDRSEYKR